MKRWGFEALRFRTVQNKQQGKWAKKTHNTPLFYIMCCVQYDYENIYNISK